MKIFTKYTKRFFVLDLDSASISYGPEKGKIPTNTIMIWVSLWIIKKIKNNDKRLNFLMWIFIGHY